jgi:hypothetical protein
MFDLGDSLRGAFALAERRLHGALSAVARADAGGMGRGAAAAMATTAQAAIFTEALLAAEHARLEEVKAVAK